MPELRIPVRPVRRLALYAACLRQVAARRTEGCAPPLYLALTSPSLMSILVAPRTMLHTVIACAVEKPAVHQQTRSSRAAGGGEAPRRCTCTRYPC